MVDQVCHLKVNWLEDYSDMNFQHAIVGKIIEDYKGQWTLLLRVRAFNQQKNKQVVLSFANPVDPFNVQWSGPREKPTAWGMQKLGEGVWALEPSLVIPDVFHAFVTIINVPSPAPWEIKQDKKENDISNEKSG